MAPDELPHLLTDDAGRVHEGGIPPSLVRRSVRDAMDAHARASLAPQFAEAVARARLDFFQPIVDLEAPGLAFGRVVLIGDAGSVARPHTAMGVPKAAGDALALVRALVASGGDVPSGLLAFEEDRLPARSRDRRSRAAARRVHQRPSWLRRSAPARGAGS